MRASFSMSLLAVLALGACQGAGPYGYSSSYQPLDEEERALATAVEWDPVMAQRRPEQWRQRSVSLFGIVDQMTLDSRGGALVTLSQRTLEPRNLCATSAEDSCRVTVSDREHSRVQVSLALAPDALRGEHALRKGSLLRVVGELQAESPEPAGVPRLQARYYRHWPIKFFVTTQARSFMKR